MNKLKNIVQSRPVYLYLLCTFFFLHGFMENAGVLPVKEFFVLTVLYLGIAFLLSCVFWLLYRDFYRANIVVFCMMGFNFFFGSIHDFLKKTFPNAIIVKYSFFVPVTIIFLIALVIFLKRTKHRFIATGRFLNYLLVLLILIDCILLWPALMNSKKIGTDLTKQLAACDSCVKPDVYLIVADEYAGKTELQDIFSFTNSAFENELSKKGFHIVNQTMSNYNATVYSMASMFTMDYLKNLQSNRVNHHDMFSCRAIVKTNNVVSFFKTNGYSFYNYTFFDFDGEKKAVTNPFFVSKSQLFTSQTFIHRIQRDIGFHLAGPKQIENFKKQHLRNNQKLESLFKKNVTANPTKPKFVYVHFAMPHHPYYFDSTGKEIDYRALTWSFTEDKNAYVEYLVYTNKKLLGLIAQIQQNGARPAIILLMSDHGFRQFSSDVPRKYYFMNLNAVYFPDRNYTKFYDGMTNVNQFRVVLNSQFGQKLPLLKDSTTYLIE